MTDGTDDGGRAVRDIDVTTPHSARIWNYWLGDKDNYQADRDAGDEFLAIYPEQRDKARACRHFLLRAVGSSTSTTIRSCSRTLARC
jgi:hypothetical protein